MRVLFYILAGLVGLLLLGAGIFYAEVSIATPAVDTTQIANIRLDTLGQQHYAFGKSQLKKNSKGQWELYLVGAPYERGIAFGALGQGLQDQKEEAFISEIKNRVPSDGFLNFLKYLIGWINRDLDEYIPQEQLQEIFGSSGYMPDRFDYIAPKFHRALSYHGAHDIGHALQNMNLVGCTSFATWNRQSAAQKLLIGRNFDFYFGEDFARDKVIAFYKPTHGYKFMSVTWAGFSGVVSGMNEKGLTVTLNSAKSEIPTKGKTPVSLIARQILQYASNIQEAYEIAASFDSFVAETFLIGSSADGRVGLIEKSPGKTALHFSEEERMIVTNHFQSKELLADPSNQEYLAEGVSSYRYQRVAQLLDVAGPLTPEDVAAILRDRNGIDGKDLGFGNEKAVNQLIAHHAVIFSPDDLVAWVSSSPYQLGEFVAYDLKKIFAEGADSQQINSFSDSLTIAVDPFLRTEQYSQYAYFAKTRDRIQHYLFTGRGDLLTEAEVTQFEKSNPNSFLTYYYLGDYYKSRGGWQRAKAYYEQGLTKEIARNSERKHMQEGLQTCIEELAND